MPVENTSVNRHENVSGIPHSWEKSLLYSFFTAGFVGAGFHPWDRAMHLSIYNKRPFLLKANFTHPLQGLSLVMIFKPFTSGSYLFSQSELQTHLKPELLARKHSESTVNILIGFLSGSLEGILKTPCNAMKAYCWNHPGIPTLQNVKNMIKRPKGMRSLCSGVVNTVERDAIFGSVYELSRWTFRNRIPVDTYSSAQVMAMNFASDSLAAGIATISCSPWNLARIINQSKKPHDQAITTPQVIRQLYRETMAHTTFNAKRKYLCTSLGIGPGILRIMADMPVKQLLLVYLPVFFNKLETTTHTISQYMRASRR